MTAIDRRSDARDVGARRLPPLRERDGLGARAGARRGLRHRPPASACSTSPPAPATWPSAPPRRAREVVAVGPHAGELRGRAPRGRARAASSSSGSRPTPRRCRSPTASSTSSPPSLGAIFAPDHQAVADELLRVCRPGGTIGMINFTPEGLAGGLLRRASRRYAPPPPPGALPPLLWGSEEHVRELFGDRVDALELTRGEYVERAATPARLLRALQGRRSGRWSRLRRARRPARPRSRRSTATSSSSPRARTEAPPGGPAEYPYEYLLVVARKLQT